MAFLEIEAGEQNYSAILHAKPRCDVSTSDTQVGIGLSKVRFVLHRGS